MRPPSMLLACAIAALAPAIQAVPPPRFIVNDVFLLNAESMSAAVDACGARPHAQAVGIDWSNANNGGRAGILCLRRERIDQLQVANTNTDTNTTATATANANATHVVQRIAVYDDRSACPDPEIELYHPQDQVVACVRRVPLTNELLASGNFISDVWVSTDLHYNSDVPGWRTIRTSVLAPADGLLRYAWQWLMTPAYSGAFITYQRPVVPIRSVRAVAVDLDANTNTMTTQLSALVCADRLGTAWETATSSTGTGSETLIDGQDANSSRRPQKMVLCYRRGDTTESDRQAHALTGVHIVTRTTTPCLDASSSERLMVAPTVSEVALCLQWKKLGANDSFVVDLALEPARTATPTFTIPLVQWNVYTHMSAWMTGKLPVTGLTGQYQLVDAVDLNMHTDLKRNGGVDRQVYLYTQPSWTGLGQDPIHHTNDIHPRLATRKPLVAHTDATTQRLTYKILQLADLHYSGDPSTRCHDVPDGMEASACSEALMTTFVNDLLALEQPDFVAFTGDNVQVYDADRRQAAIDVVTQGVEARGIPHAVIFGNHDDQKQFTRASMMDMYMAKRHAYSSHGPQTVDGVGNYMLSVEAPADGAWGRQGDAVLRMYFVDSHAYVDGDKYPNHATKYDWIKPSQIQYYRQLSEASALNRTSTSKFSTGGSKTTGTSASKLPAIMFFHIPLPEYAMDARNLRSAGGHREGVASSGVNTNLFSTLVEMQEVKATFCGHDHVNDYCYKRDGIQLCYDGGIGMGTAYGWRSVARRARVIEWEVDRGNRRTIRSWRRLFGDLATRHSEEVLYTEKEEGDESV